MKIGRRVGISWIQMTPLGGYFWRFNYVWVWSKVGWNTEWLAIYKIRGWILVILVEWFLVIVFMAMVGVSVLLKLLVDDASFVDGWVTYPHKVHVADWYLDFWSMPERCSWPKRTHLGFRLQYVRVWRWFWHLWHWGKSRLEWGSSILIFE